MTVFGAWVVGGGGGWSVGRSSATAVRRRRSAGLFERESRVSAMEYWKTAEFEYKGVEERLGQASLPICI